MTRQDAAGSRLRSGDGPRISRYSCGVNFQPFETIAYVALRIISGFAFSLHGFQKILGVVSTKPMAETFSQMWIGGIIELVAGLAIALGLLTRPMALLASGTMAVAYIQFHWRGALDQNFFPVANGGNGGELALVYCFLFLFFAVKKDHPVALDRLIFRAR